VDIVVGETLNKHAQLTHSSTNTTSALNSQFSSLASCLTINQFLIGYSCPSLTLQRLPSLLVICTTSLHAIGSASVCLPHYCSFYYIPARLWVSFTLPSSIPVISTTSLHPITAALLCLPQYLSSYHIPKRH